MNYSKPIETVMSKVHIEFLNKEIKMKSTKEKIEVMQASLNGNDIQKYINGWADIYLTNPEPEWDWKKYDYRIKPQEPQTDWSKVAKGTAVLVSNDLTQDWKESIFLEYDIGTKFEFCASIINSNTQWFKHCKLDKSAPSIINWIKNTGEEPDCNWIAKLKSGEIYNKGTGFVCSWKKTNLNAVVEYAIIE